ncbi:PREDICTED: titin-like [Nicotiana attenuata]|uniref:titin-like n=1 Tax=Nicotiana attenuata TaxID=49451 RepID=UPI000905D87C|nr:PREDICTED: titin-like [Nicotiana attenuata]
MKNQSENSSSPPKESTPTPSIMPSTTPISKKSRFKMLARKTVTNSEQIKKINEKFKESEEEKPQKSATEREETVSFETEQETGEMVLWSEEPVDEEESWREERGSGSSDASAAEGLVRLRKRFQEPVPSMKEPLEEFLKKVSDRYNPKKKKSSGDKIPQTTRAQKKRKVASSIPVEIPPKRGRATRKESKRKAAAKGKKKVSEPVDAIEIKEMDIVLHDEDEAEEVEVVTPKAMKRNTSKKKSPSEIVDVESSTLRTRSTRKSRKLQVAEEEESEEE